MLDQHIGVLVHLSLCVSMTRGTFVTVVPAVPLVSLVSVAVSVRCFGDSGTCSAPRVLGVRCCFCEVLW